MYKGMYKEFVDSLHKTDFKLVSFDIETNPAITAKFKNVYSAQFTAYAAHLLHGLLIQTFLFVLIHAKH